ncbi:NADPH-dependent F420 reductase [Arcanobacterium canis]|uniref:NAD(P)-binding domain-containing protein n=1 Tax=Arcanobacterium canis TaxID=999183 RepID=A0ABY8FXH0_9ACTO|nr:NAD(P)-binding domain-containing protein [Arcanobacterium canis]WFM83211.1 NAD(P)-binding domain-containing protein [Arcanobacterium canis]
MEKITGAAVIGAGVMGSALAEHITECSFPVWNAARRPASKLAAELPDGVGAINVADIDALPESTAVILAIPLSSALSLPPQIASGRILIDVANYWPRRDSASAFAASPRDSSLTVAAHFSTAQVAKTLNHLAFDALAFDSRPPGSPNRRAQAVAADNDDVRDAVSTFIDALGFDPVDAGALVNGRLFAPGTTIFNRGWTDAASMRRILSRAL